MAIIGDILNFLINAFILVIILQVAVSWLIAFDVLNIGNRNAQKLIKLMHRITQPVYAPIQKVIPAIGGIDITPLIVILGLSLIQGHIIYPLFYTL